MLFCNLLVTMIVYAQERGLDMQFFPFLTDNPMKMAFFIPAGNEPGSRARGYLARGSKRGYSTSWISEMSGEATNE